MVSLLYSSYVSLLIYGTFGRTHNVVLKDIFYQVRARALFLDIYVPSAYTAKWDPSLNNKMSTEVPTFLRKKNWNYFITSQCGVAIGIYIEIVKGEIIWSISRQHFLYNSYSQHRNC